MVVAAVVSITGVSNTFCFELILELDWEAKKPRVLPKHLLEASIADGTARCAEGAEV
jgi:hypothetical protein